VLVRRNADLSRLQDILESVTVHQGDIADKERVAEIIGEVQPQGIYHLAASTLMQGKTAGEEELISINVQGTLNLVEAAFRVPQLQYFINTGTFLETAQGGVPELYSATKLLATKYIESIAKSKDFPGVTLRVYTPYGPGIQTSRLVEALIAKALTHSPISLTSPQVTRDFIFVEDLADLYIEAAQNVQKCKGRIFNAGSGQATSLEDLSALVLRLTNSKSTIEWGRFKTVGYDAEYWQADMSDVFSEFAWRPKYTMESGLIKTITWIKTRL
jgi:dolichol-phosphate mannosyltransferase